MAGSQLKKLRSELKSKGLIGQTNTKSRNKKNKAPSDTRKSDKEQVIQGIRNQFNTFDARVNRVKRDVTTIENGKFVKVGEREKSNPVKLNSFLNKNLKSAYELHKSRKGKNSKLVDRRFGENSGLTQEEKMLQRFVKERESQNKRHKFSLESDEEDDDEEVDFTLTHSGKAIQDEDDTEMGHLGEMTDFEEPPRKKTKAEVMKEVIAKSKFYKAERQKLFKQTQNEIDDLDDNFQDILAEAGKAQGPSQINGKSANDIAYDEQVRGLVFDKRSVPADRTKTEEEIQREYNERVHKIDSERLKRMEGEREAEGDDLDDFWGEESDEEPEEPEMMEQDEEQEEVSFPITIEEFKSTIEKEENEIEYINKIIKTYKPHLRQGNKERMNKFVTILFKYTTENPKPEIIKILKQLSESYNEQLVEYLRQEMDKISDRIVSQSLTKSDLVYFTLCGFIFSSSDKYHLIIIPNLILMNEILTQFIPYGAKNVDDNKVGQCIFIIDVILQYQRLSKRFDPEVNNCLIRILDHFKQVTGETNESSISLDEVFAVTSQTKVKFVNKMYELIDRITGLYKDYTISKDFIELIIPFLKQYQLNAIGDINKLNNLIDKLTKLSNNTVKIPLTLQTHRKLAIKMLQPKFEDNFNPGKHYDLDLDKQEINKMKAQLKKEKKETLKDIRRQNAFETGEKLTEKIKMYDEYHSKMAKIVNSISTVEGKERNDYEKEKRRNKN